MDDPEGVSKGKNGAFEEVEAMYDFFVKNRTILKKRLVGTV